MFSLAQPIPQYSHTCILLLTYKCFWDTKNFMAKFIQVELLRGRVLLSDFDWNCATLSWRCVTQFSSQHWKKGPFLHICLQCPSFPSYCSTREKELSAFDVGSLWLSIFSKWFLFVPFGVFLLRIAHFCSIYCTTDFPCPPPPHTHTNTWFVCLWCKFFMYASEIFIWHVH